ncbi:YibE/F family protein, partial [Staphylococcus aureus]|nr:YibE/F family protein [Staphylococcus aureus]
MFLKYRNLFTKQFNIILGLFCIAFIGDILFTFNNENFYNKPICQIIDVKHVSSTPTKDEQNKRDIKYKNKLKLKI